MASQTKTNKTNRNRVLLIDHDAEADAASGLAELLRAYGYDVRVAHDVEEGLRLLRENGVGAALCDINLGRNRSSGYDFAKAVRDDPVLNSIPLLSVSGDAEPRQFVESRRAGFDQHMVKPLRPEEIESMLPAFIVACAHANASPAQTNSLDLLLVQRSWSMRNGVDEERLRA